MQERRGPVNQNVEPASPVSSTGCRAPSGAAMGSKAREHVSYPTHTLPLTWGYLKFRFTIGEAGLHCFNEIPKLTRNHTEKENDTILIHWLVA
jgi:hypothetical protein